jgi:hypothetical protein
LGNYLLDKNEGEPLPWDLFSGIRRRIKEKSIENGKGPLAGGPDSEYRFGAHSNHNAGVCQMQTQEQRTGSLLVQRNMDLARDILRAIAQNPQMNGVRDFFIESPEDLSVTGYSLEEVAHCLMLLDDAGFINASANGLIVRRLTWDGFEFLDNIKSDSVWEKVKDQARSVGGVGMKVLASLAESEVKRLLGLS